MEVDPSTVKSIRRITRRLAAIADYRSERSPLVYLWRVSCTFWDNKAINEEIKQLYHEHCETIVNDSDKVW